MKNKTIFKKLDSQHLATYFKILQGVFLSNVSSIATVSQKAIILKSRDSTWPTKVCLVKAKVFPVKLSWTDVRVEP